MIYSVAIALSLVVCAQTVACALVSGNIDHVKNGRKPNASFALLPMIPLFQLLALGITWFLEQVVPSVALWVLIALFLAFSVNWLVSFKRLRLELHLAMIEVKHDQSAQHFVPENVPSARR